jgi:hypothetical protein
MQTTIGQLMVGAIAMGFAIAALFFLRFWRITGDRLFALFALSFFVLAVNRVALGLSVNWDGRGDYFYWVRFAAFAIILLAILDKNRRRSSDSSSWTSQGQAG